MLAVALTFGGAPVHAQQAPAEEGSREDEMFGQPAPERSPPASPSQGQSDEGLAPIDQAALMRRAAEANDKLTIGGRLYLRTQYDALEEGRAQDFSLRSPNLLDVYLDARPSDRLRGYVRTRTTYDP